MQNKLTTAVLAVLFFLLTLPLVTSAQEISGSVVKILDGDTIWLLPDSPLQGVKPHKDGSVTIRLRGIDAPEKSQSYGVEAKNYLRELIMKKTVKVEIKDIDRYKRIAGYVHLDRTNINLKMVKDGYAWAYTEYLDRPYASEFYNAEKEARRLKKGLWHQHNPLPPWEWRVMHKGK